MDLTTSLGIRGSNSPAWTLLKQAHEGRTLLLLSGGADETYIVDEADSEACVHRLYEAWRHNTVPELSEDPECAAAVRQLQRVGALAPTAALRHVSRYSILWLGEPCPVLAQALARMVSEQCGDACGGLADEGADVSGVPEYCNDAAQADIVLVVRSNADWRTALDTYAAWRLRQAHLFVDLAYHHTLGIGPYVIPGETACVACLGHRVAHRWGDLPGPAQPAVSSRPHAIAALLAPLLAARAALPPLLEHSVSLNLQTLSSTRDKVFQLPWCPACGTRHEPLTGALPLPWHTPSSPAPASSGAPEGV